MTQEPSVYFDCYGQKEKVGGEGEWNRGGLPIKLGAMRLAADAGDSWPKIVEGNHEIHPTIGGEAEQEKIVGCCENAGG